MAPPASLLVVATLLLVAVALPASVVGLRPPDSSLAPASSTAARDKSLETNLLDPSRLLPVALKTPAPPVPVTDTASAAAALAAAAGLPSAQHLVVTRVKEEPALGLTHYRFDQVVPYGVNSQARVEGGDLIAHVKDGVLVGVSGTVVPGVSASLPPTVGKAAARAGQLSHVRGRSAGFRGASLSKTELRVIPTANGDLAAYCSSADLTDAVDAAGATRPALMRVCTEANGAGRVVESRDELRTALATGKSLFSGIVQFDTPRVSSVYQLKTTAAGSGAVNTMKNKQTGGTLMTDADNIWGNSLTTDVASAGVDAAWGALTTFSYFKASFGRLGIRDDGSGALSRVHYGVNYANAFWSDSCFCMTYGDGDSTWNPLVSLDVAGHEMSHGITSREANLNYAGESGGLNEATSDIFGTMVEFYANSTSDKPDYLIGEKLFKSSGALRYMYKPSLDGKSPDCWSTSVSGLDVHYSSGPANHFFFLLAEGSTGSSGFPVSPTCNGKAVTGIGRTAAAAIWYRALSTYMTQFTNYADARVTTLKAATDLYGATSANYNATAAAWDAISVA